MEDGFFADTTRLREHSLWLRQPQRTAEQLIEQLRVAQLLDVPQYMEEYAALIEKAEKMARFFSGMSDEVDKMSMELEKLSLECAAILKDY